jgi:hypothetical protein
MAPGLQKQIDIAIILNRSWLKTEKPSMRPEEST